MLNIFIQSQWASSLPVPAGFNVILDDWLIDCTELEDDPLSLILWMIGCTEPEDDPLSLILWMIGCTKPEDDPSIW